jgi:hypothetical protein
MEMWTEDIVIYLIAGHISMSVRKIVELILRCVNITVTNKKKIKPKKYLRKRYERIAGQEWFKRHYEDKSLGEVIDIVDE